MNNFYEAMNLASILYDVEFENEDDFAEIGLVAWNRIGNKRTKIYRYCAPIDCATLSVTLPCNADRLEAVTIPPEDWKYTSDLTNYGDLSSQWIEEYIEGRKIFRDPLYPKGKYVSYERVGNTLYFRLNYGIVLIIYKGYLADEDGLPELTDKEAEAIAVFAAYTLKYKEGLRTNNKDIMQVALNLKREWLIKCDLARVDEYMNQNDFEEILDAKSSWDRKSYNKSYKPVR